MSLKKVPNVAPRPRWKKRIPKDRAAEEPVAISVRPPEDGGSDDGSGGPPELVDSSDDDKPLVAARANVHEGSSDESPDDSDLDMKQFRSEFDQTKETMSNLKLRVDKVAVSKVMLAEV